MMYTTWFLPGGAGSLTDVEEIWWWTSWKGSAHTDFNFHLTFFLATYGCREGSSGLKGVAICGPNGVNASLKECAQ